MEKKEHIMSVDMFSLMIKERRTKQNDTEDRRVHGIITINLVWVCVQFVGVTPGLEVKKRK